VSSGVWACATSDLGAALLSVFDLKTFKPRNYTLIVDAEDTVQRSRVSGRAEFTVE